MAPAKDLRLVHGRLRPRDRRSDAALPPLRQGGVFDTAQTA
jgi:hypothetical protein